MNQTLHQDAMKIVDAAISAVLPDAAVQKALAGRSFPGRVYLVAVGKAAWQMAKAALDSLDTPIEAGIVLTKYDHVKGELPRVTCYEAGHPVPDENSCRGTEAVLKLTESLTAQDTVLFLLSGGGSALFEQPRTTLAEMQDVTRQLLACGADIVEMNTLRKRLSGVKGGRFSGPLRSCGGGGHRAERYSGRPAGHDRQRPRSPGYVHLRTGEEDCG